jgi:hypothetical protein
MPIPLNFQAPSCWSELPEKVWLRVLQNLPVKDVNSVHLVCRNLHQIANLHVNPKLSFKKGSPEDLESLVQSSRIFEELEFSKGSSDYLTSFQRFQILEKYLGFTGPHIKKLIISNLEVDLLILQNLLTMLPNLKSLELDRVELTSADEESIAWDLKPTKIERIRLVCSNCMVDLESFLKSLEKCVIRELELSIAYSEISMEFLNHKDDLRSLRLYLPNGSKETLNLICGLKNLETMELEGWTTDGSPLNNLHKLGKLKRLEVPEGFSKNILDHMKFGVFQNLEELDGHFKGASLESVQEMKRITPNLKKIAITSVSSDIVNAVLETLENLETVKIWNQKWEVAEKVYPKIKHLDVYSDFKFSAEQFPNLEYLKVGGCSLNVTVPFFIKLLSGLKHLKTLNMSVFCDSEFDREPILECLEEHGKHLEDAKIQFGFSLGQDFAFAKRAGSPIWITDFSFDGTWILPV